LIYFNFNLVKCAEIMIIRFFFFPFLLGVVELQDC
jgi:hypothetical protein